MDGTDLILKEFKSNSVNSIKLIRIDRKNSPLGALRALTEFIYTDFISVISGDDFFLPGYGAVARNLIQNNAPNFVTNFSQLIVDKDSIQVGRKSPRWSTESQKNRRMLLYSNPGTAAGCLLPWKYIKKVCLEDESFDTMIEDYYISMKLIPTIPFKSEFKELVAYRVHENNLTNQKMSKSYATSIGICISLSWHSAINVMEKILSLSLFVRWGRHVNVRRIPQVLYGFIKGTL